MQARGSTNIFEISPIIYGSDWVHYFILHFLAKQKKKIQKGEIRTVEINVTRSIIVVGTTTISHSERETPNPRFLFRRWCVQNWLPKLCFLSKFFKRINHILKPGHKFDQK